MSANVEQPAAAAPAPLVYTIAETCAISKLSRSYVHRLIQNGRLESVTLGRRRLIRAASVAALFENAA